MRNDPRDEQTYPYPATDDPSGRTGDDAWAPRSEDSAADEDARADVDAEDRAAEEDRPTEEDRVAEEDRPAEEDRVDGAAVDRPLDGERPEEPMVTEAQVADPDDATAGGYT